MLSLKRILIFSVMFVLLLATSPLILSLSEGKVQAAPMGQADGCLIFTETTGGQGHFSVCDDTEANFRTAFEQWGLQQIGYPISRRYMRDGFVTQAFQKAIMQWRVESNQVVLVNIFDDLHNAGLDDTLFSVRQTPHQLPPGWGEDTAAKEILTFEETIRRRQALLDTRPALKRVYFKSADPLTFYGLPTSEVEDMGNHYAIRLQRAVLQEWKEDVPWAKAGQVTIANGGDIAKELGGLPADALVPEGVSSSSSPSPTPTIAPVPTNPPTTSNLSVVLEPIVSDFTRPLAAVSPGDGSGRLLVVEKDGLIWLVTDATDPDKDAKRQELPFLDLRPQISTAYEQGLLGLVFEPNRPERFYVNYTDSDDITIIARYHVHDGNPNFAEPSSVEIILSVPQPNATHNGGHLAFGPDGYLWVGLGDGGGTENEASNGQDSHTLLGSFLRIDVSGESGYRIPADNPYADGVNGRPEVWAIGFRNPWRYSFDRVTGDLWSSDVGHGEWEEVNRASSKQAALNYGWAIREGNHCFSFLGNNQAGDCRSDGLIVPITEYDHNFGCSVTGGYVYRGQRHPQLQGKYIFGDFCNGNIWMIDADTPTTSTPIAPTLLLESGLQISSFGEDEAGELYVVDFGGGLYRLVMK